MKILLIAPALLTANMAFAAVNIPPSLAGRYAYDCSIALNGEKATGVWDGLTINKSGIVGYEWGCNATAIKKEGKGFRISETCSGGGEEWSQVTTYELVGNVLKMSGTENQKESPSYKRCGK